MCCFGEFVYLITFYLSSFIAANRLSVWGKGKKSRGEGRGDPSPSLSSGFFSPFSQTESLFTGYSFSCFVVFIRITFEISQLSLQQYIINQKKTMGQRRNLNAVAEICEFHLSYFWGFYLDESLIAETSAHFKHILTLSSRPSETASKQTIKNVIPWAQSWLEPSHIQEVPMT